MRSARQGNFKRELLTIMKVVNNHMLSLGECVITFAIYDIKMLLNLNKFFDKFGGVLLSFR
jgi:hypothetical protein